MRLPFDDPGAASERTALAWYRTSAVHAALGGFGLMLAARQDRWCVGSAAATVFIVCSYVLSRQGAQAYENRRAEEVYRGNVRGAMILTSLTLIASLTVWLMLCSLSATDIVLPLP